MPAGSSMRRALGPRGSSASCLIQTQGWKLKLWIYLSAFCLKKEVWGFQSYGFSLGLLPSSGIFFLCLVTKIFFFLLVHLKYHLTPLPIKKVDYPCKRGQNWGSYVHNSLPRFNWEYRSCFHTWKRLVCPALCILAPLLTQVKPSLSTNSSSTQY